MHLSRCVRQTVRASCRRSSRRCRSASHWPACRVLNEPVTCSGPHETRHWVSFARQFANAAKVLDELAVGLFFGVLIRNAQQERWMHGDETVAAKKVGRASAARDRQGPSCECQDGRGAQGHHEFWMYQSQLLIEPPPVVLDLAGGGFLVDAPLAALLELEMLHGIGDVDTAAIEACVRHGAVKKLTRRSDERPA